MNVAANSSVQKSCTVLVSPNDSPSELATELERYGARVLLWPKLDVGEPETHDPIDDALENLFGYDWLVCRTPHAVRFFLGRLQTLGHDVSDLDGLRVCGVGVAAVAKLEDAQIHLDVIPNGISSEATVEAIETYIGEGAGVLNFLVPCGATPGVHLPEALERAGGRVDMVVSYRTCAANDLARVHALIRGGGIDCIAFANAKRIDEFAEVFDTNDLAQLLANVAVACADQSTAQHAAEHGLVVDIAPVETSAAALALAIASHCSDA
jgi:uroporphyrinogen III methyltransferase/synthase